MNRLSNCALLLIVIGCSSASIQAVRDPNFRGPVHRLLVVIATGEARDDGAALRAAVARNLAARRVAYLAYSVSTEQEVANHRAAMDAFAPDATLLIVPTSTTVAMFGERVQVRYDASLFLTSDPERRVWRAQVVHEGDGIAMSTRLSKAADRIVEQLVADRVIAGR